MRTIIMTDYKYEKMYKGILVKSNFEITDEVCHEYADSPATYIEKPDVIYIDDKEFVRGNGVWKNINEANTVGDLMSILSKLPKDLDFKQGYASLGVGKENDPIQGSEIHVKSQLLNDETA